MNDPKRRKLRLGVFTALIADSPAKLGRTALMKMAYFLQMLKGVPLEYDFRLYTYGPFDQDVLDDLGTAEAVGAVKARVVTIASGSGYGYEFSPGRAADRIRMKSNGALAEHLPAIAWVLQEFGHMSAGDLELIATLVFADREANRARRPISRLELRRRVKQIKPRFSDKYIDDKIEELAAKGLLLAGEGM